MSNIKSATKEAKEKMETGIDSASDESSCPASPDGASAPVSVNLSDHNCYVRIDTKIRRKAKSVLLGSGANSDVYALSDKMAIKVYNKESKTVQN